MQKLFGKEIARKLREARDLMNRNGSHWTQGALYNHGRQAYCSIGAIRQVINGNPYTIATGPEYQLADALVPYLSFPPGTVLPLANREKVVKWNDTPGRTWAEVSNAFEAAARDAEAS